MYDVLVEKTAAFLGPKIGCTKGDPTYDRLCYGAYAIYINGAKCLLLFVVAALLRVLPHVLIFALAYGALRPLSLGVHLNRTGLCTLLGLTYHPGRADLSPHLYPALWHLALPLADCGSRFPLSAPMAP